MDYTKKISTTSKQCNYLQNKPMSEQVRQLLIEDLKKKKNKQNNEQKETFAQENKIDSGWFWSYL